MRALLAALLLFAPGLAFAGDKDALEVVGFSDDCALFAWFTYGVSDGSGFPHAELNVVSTANGKPVKTRVKKLVIQEASDGDGKAALEKLRTQQSANLAQAKLGSDPGVELYRSGTATKTSFVVEGRNYELALARRVVKQEPRTERVMVGLETGGNRRIVFSGGEGFDFSLNSVRVSASGKCLGVLLKHSTGGFEGPNRRFLGTAARL